MIQRISIQPYQIREYACLTLQASGDLNKFPLLCIDRDSYIVSADIQSGINFSPKDGRHCIAVGKVCSLAESITFMIDLNHDYSAVCQGNLFELKDMDQIRYAARKASIIIQNDVWVGHGATIMAGVTLHNGCAVAANAVVTKDVPPYTIVGGNPAKPLRRRCDEEDALAMQKIAWWNWPEQLLKKRKQDFALPIRNFIEKYLPEKELVPLGGGSQNERSVVLLIPDVKEAFPLWPHVLKQYFAKDRPENELLIYLPKKESNASALRDLNMMLKRFDERDSFVTLQTGEDLEEDSLFQIADYFVTTRGRELVARTCLADLYGTKILYGTDDPVFPF